MDLLLTQIEMFIFCDDVCLNNVISNNLHIHCHINLSAKSNNSEYETSASVI